MSGVFIVIYAGWPLRFPWLDLTSRSRASQFVCEADAWFEVHRAHLNPRHCRVEGLEERNEHLIGRRSEAMARQAPALSPLRAEREFSTEVSTGSKVSS